MDYAQRECADCHGMFSASQMVGVSDKVRSGESVTATPYKGSDGNTYRNTSTTTHYTIERKLICSECKRQRTRAIIRNALMLIVAGAALLAFFGLSGERSRPADVRGSSTTEFNSTDTTLGGTSDQDFLAHEESMPTSETDNTTPVASGPENAPERSVEEDSRSSRSTGSTSPKEQAAIGSAAAVAVQTALSTGSSARWSAAGLSGWVVVSSAQTIAGRECRNVSGTVINHDRSQTPTPTHLWCQGAGEKWAVAN